MALMGINFTERRKKYFQRLMAMLHQCQKLNKQEPKFESNISSKFDMQKMRLNVCVIQMQNDAK